MNLSCESVGASAIRILSRMMNPPRPARPRRFRPLAVPMEARVVLSHVCVTPAIVAPAETASVGVKVGLRLSAMDTVIVNGQVEVQPGD